MKQLRITAGTINVGELEDWNGEVELGNYREWKVSVTNSKEEYTIDGITLTKEQAKQISAAYNGYQELKKDIKEIPEGVAKEFIKKIMNS